MKNIISHGISGNIQYSFFIELFAVLVLIEIVDFIVSRIINSTALHIIIECLTVLTIALGAGYFFNWYSMSPKNVVIMRIITLGVYALTVLFFIRKKQDSGKKDQ